MLDGQQYLQGIIAQVLAERVVQKLLGRQKQALVVYTGSNMGIEAGLENLRMLRQEDGFTYRVLLTKSAAGILDAAAIRSALEPEEFWVGQPGDSPEAMTARYDTILVPALTVNTAAHVAACMADTPAAAIILDGLMRGKNVVVAVDGCCPDNPERLRRGFHMAEGLKKKLREQKDALRDYGAYLTTAGHLREAANQAIMSFAPAADPAKAGLGKAAGNRQDDIGFAPVTMPVQAGLGRAGGSGQDMWAAGSQGAYEQPDGKPGRQVQSLGSPELGIQYRAKPTAKGDAPIFRASLEGRVFSVTHIKPYPDHATVIVPKRTIITQLASDEARARGIQIEIES